MIAGNSKPKLVGKETPPHEKATRRTLGGRMTTTKGNLKEFSATNKKQNKGGA